MNKLWTVALLGAVLAIVAAPVVRKFGVPV